MKKVRRNPMEVLPVVIRLWPDGEAIALFPTIPADPEGNALSYSHVGQHGAADYDHVVNKTKPGYITKGRRVGGFTSKEARDLFWEVHSIYADEAIPQVRERASTKMHDERLAELREMQRG